MTRSDLPDLADLDRLTAPDVAALPAETLAHLHAAAEAALQRAKARKEHLEAGLAHRYDAAAAAARQTAGKDFGTVRLADGEVTIVHDLPKKVTWDQARLARLAQRIAAAGGDPGQYLDVTYKVPERKYAAWPDPIRAEFTPARTVAPGKPRVRLELGEG